MKKSRVIAVYEDLGRRCDRSIASLKEGVRRPESRGRARAVLDAAIGLPLAGLTATLAEVAIELLRRTSDEGWDPE